MSSTGSRSVGTDQAQKHRMSWGSDNQNTSHWEFWENFVEEEAFVRT